ncbi:hypothetical protein CNMCM5623_006731 [Aspergillus felis]|uniref:Putative transcription factor kapC n=1 Tax=Aspergillus felis TaxID=1287682 RepID=A0A8H6UR15_9EURO|nr:hypothetical protein CNMCM5623_006731 [Aspergillus felis]
MADVTQAAKLDKHSLPTSISGLTERLKTRKDYELWTFYAKSKCELELHELEDLINKSISRPAETYPNYRLWSNASKLVRNWLIGQVGKDIANTLRVTTDLIACADDMWEAIKNIILGHGHSESRSNFKKTVYMKRSDFATIAQYVANFRDRVDACERLKTPITPYRATLLMLEELSKELPSWCNVIESKFTKDSPESLSKTEFHENCMLAIDKGNEYEAAFGAKGKSNAQTSKQSSQSNQTQFQPLHSPVPINPTEMDSASSSLGKRRFTDLTSAEEEPEYNESACESDGDDGELFIEPEDQDLSSPTTGIIGNANNTAFQSHLQNILHWIIDSDHADQAHLITRERSGACYTFDLPAPFNARRFTAANIISQVLHDQLLAAHQHLSHPQQARPQPAAPQPPHMQPNTPARDQNNIDPAISGATMLTGPPQTPSQPDVGQESPKTYGKRPLSTSKRAAQNRAAQRAFRQRKEAHIRELEGKVKAYENMGEAIKALQAENYQLREYIINLQSRLLDSQGEVPELPGNIDLSQPRSEIPVPPIPNSGTTTSSGAPPPAAPQQPQPAHAQAPTSNDDMNSLNRIAVAGLGMRKPPTEEANYLGNNFQAQARRVRPDEGQTEAPELPKQEQTHGLPLIS